MSKYRFIIQKPEKMFNNVTDFLLYTQFCKFWQALSTCGCLQRLIPDYEIYPQEFRDLTEYAQATPDFVIFAKVQTHFKHDTVPNHQ
ncbi:hypothetical protein B1207_04790 [Legionella quinlivanii]|uniref:Uncharacterized protein n=1 Tax=Legionella quinlivanii TaxID=45073 RepID=A0A364LL88_9GAMM|nr:hypothetical protein B1207_04790 [Legionella quinlivanii]